jgi:integrase
MASKKSSRRVGRVVKYKRADGTKVEKRYPPYKPTRSVGGRTVGDLLSAWEGSPRWAALAANTKDSYQTYSRHLLVIEHAPVVSVTRTSLLDIRDAVIRSRGPGAGAAFARMTSAVFTWAVDRGWLEHSVATRLGRDIELGHLPAWTEGDVASALRSLPEHLRRPVVLALYTGQRRGDLVTMPWSAYDGQKIRLTQQKTGWKLAIPAPAELRAELDAWGPASGTILVNKFGRPWTPTNLSQQMGYALAEIDGFPRGRNIHGLRKLAAARLAQAGCTTHEIAAITGHKSLAMVQLYTKSIDQERSAESADEKLAIYKNLQNHKKPWT